MADTEASAAPEPVVATTKAAPKKGKAASAKKSPAKKAKKPTSNHPKVSEMVIEALLNLRDRKGSSLQAVKKYIAGNFKVDVEKLAPFIRRYIKSAVTDGSLVQTKGTGASGSFKLGEKLAPKTAKKPAEPEKKPVKKVVASPKKVAPQPVKKASPKKVKAAKKPKSPKKAKTPKKEKKAKTPKKTKSPKPKKAAAKKPAKK